jgi:hypothetical protein
LGLWRCVDPALREMGVAMPRVIDNPEHWRARAEESRFPLRSLDSTLGHEANDIPYRSKRRMHACGHDGHTTMLLGAARYLAETRNFTP